MRIFAVCYKNNIEHCLFKRKTNDCGIIKNISAREFGRKGEIGSADAGLIDGSLKRPLWRKSDTFNYIEMFYNLKRRYSAYADLAPVTYENA